MILINKYEPSLSIDDVLLQCAEKYSELSKIFDFIDLPDSIKAIERANSSILRNYYANALDNNLLEIKTVKYLVNKNLRPSNLSEIGVEQFSKAELFLSQQVHQSLSIPLLYEVERILIEDLYKTSTEFNLFSKEQGRIAEKLSLETEIELESLFEFLNNDTEFHPIIQSWMLHFKILSLSLFSEASTKFASLLQRFWLNKKGMDMSGFLSLEHELYLNKQDYEGIISRSIQGEENILDVQIRFGIKLHQTQLNRLRELFKSYFRKQVDFERLNPRQKNIMNYVFERGYKLKEIDETVLNKRQKLIMYIVQHRGFISTKELVNEFDCNRKTIQRDFQLLMDLGFVKSIGAGAGLKYCINLHEKGNPQLERYQADFVNTYQEEEDKSEDSDL